ncbi:unnamed protein product [Clonostachys rosea]|uniref:GH64 domain-containing protein n=1 Tax=Bionectria ochroleuca TaxID=29856 RepID=A0ABY6TWZ5_BIOOC|nr:unnamed protein product [Clonostachys rosea]
MRFLSFTLGLLGSAITASATMIPNTSVFRDDGFTAVNPGSFKDMIVTDRNTLNGTRSGDALVVPLAREKTVAPTLPLQFVNNFGSAVNAYISGLDSKGAVVFVAADGSLIYPSSGGSKVPVKITQNIKIPVAASKTLSMTLPMSLTSGRIYYSVGELYFGIVSTGSGDGLVQPAPNNPSDPSAAINWGFVELTLTSAGVLYANISYVDFLGLPLGMKLAVNGGTTQTAYGVAAGAVTSVCNDLATQKAKDGRPWTALCQANSKGPVRVLSPTLYTDLDSSSFQTYWDSYISQVWSKYTSTNLVIDTQNSAGKVNCRVSGSTLTCAGDNRGYSKPTARDIWGCNSGPFGKQAGDNDVHLAVIPRLCAAFVRSTLLLSGGNVQPSLGQVNYYTANPTNHYSRVVHTKEVDGKGYAFAYDDVNPTGTENASGTVSHGSPKTLTVYIGSPP